MSPLLSICFCHMFDSYFAVITVSLNSGSSSEGSGVDLPELVGDAAPKFLGSLTSVDGGETLVNVQRPNAQLRMYLARSCLTSKDGVGLLSDDRGGVNA